MAASFKNELGQKVGRYRVDKAFGEEADVPGDDEETAVHADVFHFSAHVREKVRQHVRKYLCGDWNSTEVLKIVIGQYILNQAVHNPESLLLCQTID